MPKPASIIPFSDKYFNNDHGISNDTRENDLCSLLQFIDSYINLVNDIQIVSINKGLFDLYSYRTGVVISIDRDPTDLDGNHPSIAKSLYERFIKDSNASKDKTMQLFAHSCIAYNSISLTMALTDVYINMIKVGYGNANFLTGQACTLINTSIRNPDTLENNIDDVLLTLQHIANLPTTGSPNTLNVVGGLLDMMNDMLLRAERGSYDKHIKVLRIIYYIVLSYANIDKLRLRQSDSGKKLHYKLNISDTTLACIPFTPSMIKLCGGEDTTVSRIGSEYVQNLERVIRLFSGLSAVGTTLVPTAD